MRELPDPEGARSFTSASRRRTRAPPAPSSATRGCCRTRWRSRRGARCSGRRSSRIPTISVGSRASARDARVRTTEELSESLARFALTTRRSSRRSCSRVFAAASFCASTSRTSAARDHRRDDRGTVEPRRRHARPRALARAAGAGERLRRAAAHGRARAARRRPRSAIVALGKLGSRELNYASDIDLLFLYSDDGETSGRATRGAMTNREYLRQTGRARRAHRRRATGRGRGLPRRPAPAAARARRRARRLARRSAALLPREGAGVGDAGAHPLARGRGLAGALRALRRRGARAASIRSERDRRAARSQTCGSPSRRSTASTQSESRGFNVKLGRGGIREIEFIAQALQLAHGGRDAWLHAPHTLISLGRLADRGLIAERERTELSDAYDFLRTVEHRLQMEHGLQTHTVPEDAAAARCSRAACTSRAARALEEFDARSAPHLAPSPRLRARLRREDESRRVVKLGRMMSRARTQLPTRQS